MQTPTLTEARRALLELQSKFDADSITGGKLTTIAQYLEAQVPLNIEKSSLELSADKAGVTVGFLTAIAKDFDRTTANINCTGPKRLGLLNMPPCDCEHHRKVQS